MVTLISRRASHCARRTCAFAGSLALLSAIVIAIPGLGAEFTTDNFHVHAEKLATARHVGERAEELRTVLSTEWLGVPLEQWSDPCRIFVDTDSERLKGDTTYLLSRGRVTRWRMELHGPLDRILETLLPHEIVHTILASHFKAAIPRWADEGAALMAEDPAERHRLWLLEERRLTSSELPPLLTVLDATEYPKRRDTLRTFYVRGACLAEFLLHAGKPRFLEFVSQGMSDGWDVAVRVHYGFEDVAELEAAWMVWLRDDRPAIQLEGAQLLAAGLRWNAAGDQAVAALEDNVVRQQSRDPIVDEPSSDPR